MELRTLKGQIAAIDRVQAIIEFSLDGIILDANENFLSTMGYTLAEIRGQHHGMFVDAQQRASDEYRRFWEKLRRGEFDAGQYQRLGKGGRVVWLQASYNPILDAEGRPVKVMKFATDITPQKVAAAEAYSVLQAIGRVQAIIEFGLDGTIISANENFLKTMGYTLDEIRGRHHSMFIDPRERDSAEYGRFWQKLGRG